MIVLAIDGTPAAGRAVELLATYRGEPSLLDILVVNVQSRPVAIWPEAAIDVTAIEDALVTAGRETAEKAVGHLRSAGLDAEAVARLGFAVDAILREAESRKAELIVMGTRGHGVIGGFALGSVAMRVAHTSPTAVCLVRSESRLPAKLGASLRVMLAVDGSEPALRAASTLASWRVWLGELDVQIVHVQQPLSYLETVLPPHDDVIQQWSTRAGEDAARPARELLAKAGIQTHLHLTIGDPAQEIVHLAAETGCELLVMGTRGLGAAHHAFIGSVALKAAAHCAVPVVLAK